MSVVTNKRSIMTLYTGDNDLYSHQTRIVLAEKGVAVDHILLKPSETPEVLAELNPYNTVPTLVDRELVLYKANIIMEYLDERFPHPPLLPIYPVARARARLMMHRIDKEWASSVAVILADPKSEEAVVARNDLKQSLLAAAKIFTDSTYFLSDDFSLIDACVAPILWRLPVLGIQLPPAKGKAIREYMDKIFNRESFQASLTEVEQEMQI